MRLAPPYLHGALLAVNAVDDLYFLGDGPDCMRAKAEHIAGRHDLFSSLLSCTGDHRVQYTGVNVFNIASDSEGALADALRRMASWPACAALLLGSMPMCTVAGTDYERILREMSGAVDKPAFLVPPRTGLSGDWLDGYAAVLDAVARGIDLGVPRPEDGAVALVGHLMARTEGDERGNVAELERLVRALRLEPVSVWLSGRPYAHLREARRASAVISLPHGRRAAAVLARRLGARLVETELPFGLPAARRFVESLGRELGRLTEASALVRAELDDAAPRLQWTVSHAFLGRRFVFVGDPHHGAAFAEMIEELGGEMSGMILMGAARHLPESLRTAVQSRPHAAFEPAIHEVSREWFGLAHDRADLLVTNTMGLEHIGPRTAWMEFGYPSDHTHVLGDEPFLGFRGAVSFLSRTANEVARGLCQRWMRP